MRLFDSHCHVNFRVFEEDSAQVIGRAREAGVEILVVGTDLKTCRKAVEQAEKFAGKGVAGAAVGFHPLHTKDRDWLKEVAEIRELAGQKAVKAIGETGFDIYGNDLTLQKELFEELVGLAEKLGKPIILHCRGFLAQMEQELRQRVVALRKIGLVFHCFPGDLKLARWLVEQGFYLGFNGMITKKRDWDKVIKDTALKYILLETDAPFLLPAGVAGAGGRNQPVYIGQVAERVAQIKGIGLEEVAEQTYENSLRFFGLEADLRD